MFAVGDTRSIWDGRLPDIGLDASADQAKRLAEEIVRRDWGVARLEWRLDQRGAWTAVTAPSPDTTPDTTGPDEPV